jgi:hypothetical protein
VEKPTKNPEAGTRRSFLKRSMVAGAAATVGAGLLTNGLGTLAHATTSKTKSGKSKISDGDIAILQFLAAAEIIETDLWVQYAELGGLTTGTQNPYQLALQQLDGDAAQYITSNTLDEMSHANFLNSYLKSKGASPTSLARFRTLPGSQATGAKQIPRLTNLSQLTVDTSWYVRYRSKQNPDFGATFPQAFTIANKPAIPMTNADFGPNDHIQAIADTAAFHFGTIEQGGSSLYSAMAQKANDVEVLQIVVSIGGDEVAHLVEWVDFAGNGASSPLAPLTDPVTGLFIPDLNASGSPLTQTNLIFPVACEFIDPSLPNCAVIRPTNPAGIAAGVVTFLTEMGLFIGQTTEFFDTLNGLAAAADAAQRGF